MNHDTAPTLAADAVPAAFRRRYAAYSLDFAVLATLATALGWTRLHAGWRQVHAATGAFVADVGQRLADGMMAGHSPQALAQALAHDPAIHAAAQALQASVWRMCLPWLLAYLVLAALWHLGGELSRWRGSPGKYLLGMRVVDHHDGDALGPARTVWRFVACLASWLTLNLGHLLAAATPRRRALHDYLAGSEVRRDAAADRLPPWARAWLWLQLAALVLGTGWVVLRYVLALRASLGLA